jgi:hypothetical protein
VGPSAGLDDMDRNLAPTGARTPTSLSSTLWPIAIPTALFRLPTDILKLLLLIAMELLKIYLLYLKV